MGRMGTRRTATEAERGGLCATTETARGADAEKQASTCGQRVCGVRGYPWSGRSAWYARRIDTAFGCRREGQGEGVGQEGASGPEAGKRDARRGGFPTADEVDHVIGYAVLT